jgi:O-antigen ligase
MMVLGRKQIDTLPAVFVGVLVLLTLGAGLLDPTLLPWAILLAAAGALLVFWAVRWDVTTWAWLWVLSYGILDWPGWKIEVSGFFNLSVPRFIFLGGLVLFGLYFLAHRRRIHVDRKLLWVMFAVTLYFGVSAHVSGWTAQVEAMRTAPYYRFIGSILLPFVMFFMVYNTGSSDRQIRRGLLLVTFYGWFALYIGYLQFAAIQGAGWARGFIWPAYINDPTWGIHFDRARGAFSGVSPQAVFLVTLFFVDLYLIRKIRGAYRLGLMLQAVLVVPAIYFCLLRSAYLSFLLCGGIWIVFAGDRRYRALRLAGVAVLVAVAVFASWERLQSTDRKAGGVAQMNPIRSRQILVAQTWEIVKEAPLTGVGFGHFVDAQQSIPRDPASLVGATSGVLVQHNLFLNLWAETGVIGLAGVIVLFVLLFRQSKQLYRKLPAGATGGLSREFVVLFWIVLVNYLVDAMFRDPLWHVFSNAMLWTFAGLIVCFNRLLEPQPLDLPIAPQRDER